MRSGDISPAQAKEIADLPEHEDELLELAKNKSLGAVKDAVRAKKLAGIDRDELHRKQRAARKFATGRTGSATSAYPTSSHPSKEWPS